MIRVRARTQRRRGSDKLHRDVLHAMNAALAAADPTRIIRKNLKLTGSILHVDRLQYPLKDYRRILVIGGVKASVYIPQQVKNLLFHCTTRFLLKLQYYRLKKP